MRNFRGGIKICDYFAKKMRLNLFRVRIRNFRQKNISRKMRHFYISLETLHLDSIAGKTEAEFLKFYGQSRENQSLNRELIPSAGFTLTLIILTWAAPDTI